ncbi:MAG: flagellin [Planctomycetota bacterium]|nr:MAG: flagellin [Planctomycetota bacterium]
MLSISSSMSLMIGQRGLRDAQSVIAQAAERLATGKRINRAADDPSGLIASERFSAEIVRFEKKIDGLEQQRAMLGAKEGALSVVTDLLHELNGLVVSAANTGGLSTEELEAMQTDADEIIGALDMISNTATFKGVRLFSGLFSNSLGRTSVEDEGDPDDTTDDTTLQAVLGSIRSGGALNLIDGDLEAAQKSVEGALGSISLQRGAIGSKIKNEIEPEINLLLEEIETHTDARSDLVDADIAAEMSNLIRGQLLQQASINALLAARQAPNAALQLLQSSVNLQN